MSLFTRKPVFLLLYVAKTKALISCMITAQLICIFVLSYAKSRFSHESACIVFVLPESMLNIVSQTNPVDGTVNKNDHRYINGSVANP